MNVPSVSAHIVYVWQSSAPQQTPHDSGDSHSINRKKEDSHSINRLTIHTVT